jgi:hypothetical protein
MTREGLAKHPFRAFRTSADCVRFASDSVAKVFLFYRSQILGCTRGDRALMWGNLHSVTSSLATSVARLRLHRSTVAACFVVRRKFRRFGTFATRSPMSRHRCFIDRRLRVPTSPRAQPQAWLHGQAGAPQPAFPPPVGSANCGELTHESISDFSSAALVVSLLPGLAIWG